MRPKIIICGHGRHGKDTMAEYLEAIHGFAFVSSSKFCSAKLMFNTLKDKYGYKTPLECFEDRHNHRTEWFDTISEYCKENPAKLTKEIFGIYLDVFASASVPKDSKLSKGFVLFASLGCPSNEFSMRNSLEAAM